MFFTAQGSRLEPFGCVEWALRADPQRRGSSFLLIEIGLESLEPATITWVRVALGFLVLTVFPAARKPVERADYYGFALNLAVPLQQRYGAPAVMCRALGVAAVATAPFGLAGLTDSRWDTGPVLAVTVLGVVGTGAAFVIMAALVGRVGATRGGVAIYLSPWYHLPLRSVAAPGPQSCCGWLKPLNNGSSCFTVSSQGCYRLAPVAVLHTGTAQQAVAAYAAASGQPFTSSRTDRW